MHKPAINPTSKFHTNLKQPSGNPKDGVGGKGRCSNNRINSSNSTRTDLKWAEIFSSDPFRVLSFLIMPSFPPPGSVTVCEINRDLSQYQFVTSLLKYEVVVFYFWWNWSFFFCLLWIYFSAVTADCLSDDRANDTYGKVLVSNGVEIYGWCFCLWNLKFVAVTFYRVWCLVLFHFSRNFWCRQLLNRAPSRGTRKQMARLLRGRVWLHRCRDSSRGLSSGFFVLMM